MKRIDDIASRFSAGETVTDSRPFGSGNINETFLVTAGISSGRQFILQRINTGVFRKPELLMLNMKILTTHVHERLLACPLSGGRRWELPLLLMTDEGATHWTAGDGSVWRAMTLIENARSFDTIRDSAHAHEAGYALGLFHSLTSDLSPDRMADTLEGFHIAPRYLDHYDEVHSRFRPTWSPELRFCSDFIERRRGLTRVLENAKSTGELPVRIIHGDPKISNVLLDSVTGQAVSIVDLDTVKPGLVHYDIGDCLRSGCNPLGEETSQWEAVRFETDLGKEILRGYLGQARAFLTGADNEYIYDSVRLLTFELGLRFFTDHMEGNVYFRTESREHNLLRALVQFRLTESIETQEAAIRAIIKDLQ